MYYGIEYLVIVIKLCKNVILGINNLINNIFFEMWEDWEKRIYIVVVESNFIYWFIFVIDKKKGCYMKYLIKGDLICKKICMFVKFVE